MFVRNAKRSKTNSTASRRSHSDLSNDIIELDSDSKASVDNSGRYDSEYSEVLSVENSTEAQAISNYIEPKLPFSLKALVNKKYDEVSDLRCRLSLLTTKFEEALATHNLELSKKQDAIYDKEQKIEDLEKSLVFLISSEKEALESIGSLEEKLLDFQKNSDKKVIEETKLRDTLQELKEKILLLETENNSAKADQLEKNMVLETEVETLKEENLLLKERIKVLENCSKDVALGSQSIDNNTSETPNEDGSQTALLLSQQLTESQKNFHQLQKEFKVLVLQNSEFKKSHEKYSILLEEKRSLEANVKNLKQELENLNTLLSSFDIQSQSWANFFASHQEFETIDDLWNKLTETQKTLKEKENEIDILTSRINQRDLSLDSLKKECATTKTSLESAQKQVLQGQFQLKKAEKLVSLSNKEIDLLKNKLAIYSSIEDTPEEEDAEQNITEQET